jgi:hypothetical protein
MKPLKFILPLFFLAFSFSAFSQDSGEIYFMRYTGTKGSLVNMKVYIDGNLTCKLKNNTYSIHSMPVGEHTVSVQSGGLPGKSLQALKITVSKDKPNYIQLMNNSSLYCQEVSENSAQIVLKRLKKTANCETTE